MKLKNDRRQFLQNLGFGSASLFTAPLFDSLLSQALGCSKADPSVASRLLIFVTPHGLNLPKQISFNNLPESLKPLEAFKSDLNIVTQLHNSYDARIHGNFLATLSCAAKKESGSRGHSIDVEIGESDNFKNFKFPFLTLGLANYRRDVITVAREALIPSATRRGFSDRISPLTHPQQILERVFSGVGSGSRSAADMAKLTRGNIQILDQILTKETQILMRKLAGEERVKMESYLASLENLQGKLKNSTSGIGQSASCSKPAADTKLVTTEGFKVDNSQYVEKLDFLAESAAAAMICGLTKVVSLAASPFVTEQTFPYLNGPDNLRDYHDLSHNLGGREGADAKVRAMKMLTMIEQFNCQRFAKIYEKLKATPEGNGTMADNTLMIWLSDGGGVHHYGHKSIPVVMLGGAGGRLKTGAAASIDLKGHSMREFWTTVANLVGHCSLTAFGEEGSDVCRGRITKLMP